MSLPFRKRDWKEYRMRILTESEDQKFNLDKKLKIKYKLPSDSLIQLSLHDINSCISEYKAEKNSYSEDRYGGLFIDGISSKTIGHSLNKLYQIIEKRGR